ncbi:MAG TPA: SAM-dependent methyltransferase, partial [Ferruginibacter sp.]|nr:SAM-dependent methyltransferase [Ferruginibacter sp.]
MNFFSKDRQSAFDAKETAQWIAFGPVIFQAARVLRNTGILSAIDESQSEGITLEAIAAKTKVSE